MAKSLNQTELNLEQYLPARKPLVQEKLVELLNADMPTVGQLLGLILGEDQALLKMAQSDVTGKINLFDADADRITGQITATDNAFRAKVITPNIASEQILTATSAYRDSLAQLDAQKLKVSGALENLGSQAQQLRNAKTHSGKLESGLSAVIEKVGDRPIPVTILAALFSFGQEKPPAVVEQTALPTVDLDQIALRATTQMASLHTRKDDHLLAENITVSVKSARPVGRPKLSNTPTLVHLNVSAILAEEGIKLSDLAETNAQGVAVSLKALLRNDVGIEDPTLDDMEKALRGIVRGDYRELLDNRRTLLTLDGLAKPRSAPAKIEEIKLEGTQAKEVVITATPTVQPQRAFATPEPKARKPLVIGDDDPLAVALKTKKGGHLETQNAGYLAYGVTGVWLDSADKRADAGKKKALSDLSLKIESVIRVSRAQGIVTIDDLIGSQAINLPGDIKDNLRTSMKSIRETTGNEKFQLPVEALENLPELITLRTNSPFKPKTMPDLLLLLAKQQARSKSLK